MMKILCVGDVVGSVGCSHLRKVLPNVKKEYDVDVCIVNGENSADGNGITPVSAKSIFDSGADVITGGNHTFRRPEFFDELENDPFVIRPANFPEKTTPGKGVCVVDRGSYQVMVINLQGTVYMDSLKCPFEVLDEILENSDVPKFCIIDFHAEATSEKKAMGYYSDGRVSAVFGTHTHVQTNDAKILEKGTAVIADVGMTGPINSILGVKPELSIKFLKSKLPVRFEIASDPCEMNSVLITLDEKTGKATDIQIINI